MSRHVAWIAVVAACAAPVSPPRTCAIPGLPHDPRVAAALKSPSSIPEDEGSLREYVETLTLYLRHGPSGDPQAAELYRRLAETNAMLVYAVSDGAAKADASRAAIQAYEAYMKVEDPNYKHRDEVLFYLGFERDRSGDQVGAEADYRELARLYPTSSYRRLIAKRIGE